MGKHVTSCYSGSQIPDFVALNSEHHHDTLKKNKNPKQIVS